MDSCVKFGRYVLLEKIAQGGTAELWKAELSCAGGFKRIVAIKRLLPVHRKNLEIRQLLIDEAKILALMQHAHLIQVFELGEEDDLPFIAMEYVDGIDCELLLRRIIIQKTPIPIPIAIYIMKAVLSALNFAHCMHDESGRPLKIIHRDVSPSNILISWNGEINLTDFGIAKGEHRTYKTITGGLRGKFSYMSPEQAGGDELDLRTDIFSSGIVLFELITASRLFYAKNDIKTLEMVRKADLPEWAISRIPPSIYSVIKVALNYDRKLRYSSAEQMNNDLTSIANSFGGIGTSVDLAAFLSQNFPHKTCESKCNIEQKSIHTRVYGKSIPKIKWARHFTLLSASFFLALIISFRSGNMLSYSNLPKRTVKHVQSSTSNVLHIVPPKLYGTIAVDSTPSNIKGVLNVGDKSYDIATPYTISKIDIKKSVPCKVQLIKDGYHVLDDNFILTHSAATYVKNYNLIKHASARLYVQAKPWGIVHISGVVADTETPITGKHMKAGNYLLRIKYPPSGKELFKRINISDGDSVKCFADFPKTVIYCAVSHN